MSQIRVYHSQEDTSDYEDIISTKSTNEEKFYLDSTKNSSGFSFEDNEKDLAFNLQMLSNKNDTDETIDEETFEAQSINSNFDEFYDAICNTDF